MFKVKILLEALLEGPRSGASAPLRTNEPLVGSDQAFRDGFLRRRQQQREAAGAAGLSRDHLLP